MSGSSAPAAAGFWASLWQRWAPWAEEQEQRQERQAVRETGAAQDNTAENLHAQKVLRRDIQTRLDKAEAAGKAIKAVGGAGWEKKAMPHVKQTLALRKELAQKNALIDTLETLLNTMPSAAANADTAGVMRDASAHINVVLKQVGDVDDIADVLADVDDSLRHAQDVAEAMAQPLGSQAHIDDDSLQSVFDEWNEEDASKQMARVELGERQAREAVLSHAQPQAVETETGPNDNNRRGGGGALLNTPLPHE